MNFEQNNSLKKFTSPVDKLEMLNEIKSPGELFDFLKNNIQYGFVGKDDKIYSPQHEGWGKGEQPEQKIQEPGELLESGYGTCWEQTELERLWFSQNNYEHNTFLISFGENISQKNPAHTFLTYKKDNKWHWFENTLDNHNGIHEFDSEEDLIEHVKKILKNNAQNNGASEKDLKQYKISNYSRPENYNDAIEFFSQIKK